MKDIFLILLTAIVFILLFKVNTNTNTIIDTNLIETKINQQIDSITFYKLQLDSITQLNDIYFDSINVLHTNSILPLKTNLKTNMDSLNTKYEDTTFIKDIRDTIIKQQDSLIEYKTHLTNKQNIIIHNLKVKEPVFESKLIAKDSIISLKQDLNNHKQTIIDQQDKDIKKLKRQRIWSFIGSAVLITITTIL